MESITLSQKIIYGILIFIHYFLIQIVYFAYILFFNNFELGLLILFILLMIIISYYLCEVCLLSIIEYCTIPIYKYKIYNFFSEKYENPIFCNIYLKKSLFDWYNPAIIAIIFLFLITLVKIYFIHYGKKVCEWENVHHRIVFYIIGVFCSILFLFNIYKRFKRINKELLLDKEDIKNEKE